MCIINNPYKDHNYTDLKRNTNWFNLGQVSADYLNSLYSPANYLNWLLQQYPAHLKLLEFDYLIHIKGGGVAI